MPALGQQQELVFVVDPVEGNRQVTMTLRLREPEHVDVVPAERHGDRVRPAIVARNTKPSVAMKLVERHVMSRKPEARPLHRSRSAHAPHPQTKQTSEAPSADGRGSLERPARPGADDDLPLGHRHCERCRDPFAPKRIDSRFCPKCGDAARSAAYRERKRRERSSWDVARDLTDDLESSVIAEIAAGRLSPEDAILWLTWPDNMLALGSYRFMAEAA